jgi:dolichol-phosphate mannosyltransferase
MAPPVAIDVESYVPPFHDTVWPDDDDSLDSSRSVAEAAPAPRVEVAPDAFPRSPVPPPPDVSIVLASLNERENLPRLISQIGALGLGSYEVIVVDDGSTDGTREYLERAGQADRRIRALFNHSKQTLTVAHLQGILAARGTYVVVMDSDLQHPASAVPELVARLRNGADLVVGSRYLQGGSVGGRPPFRGVISRTATLIARITLRETRGLSDPISGLFAFRRAVFRPFDPRYRGYETILFLLVMCRGRPIAEIGYEFQPRPSGTSEITQDFSFVRVFLTQVVLALRFRRSLLADRGRATRELSPDLRPTRHESPRPARLPGVHER